MGLLFNRGDDSDDGCTAHHWDEHEPAWRSASVNLRIEQYEDHSVDYLDISVPMRARCQHSGCSATDDKLGLETFKVPMDALCMLHDELDEMADVAEDVHEEYWDEKLTNDG